MVCSPRLRILSKKYEKQSKNQAKNQNSLLSIIFEYVADFAHSQLVSAIRRKLKPYADRAIEKTETKLLPFVYNERIKSDEDSKMMIHLLVNCLCNKS